LGSDLSPNITLARFERCGKSAKSWNISPTPRRSGGSKRASPATSAPLIRMRPASGRPTPAARRSSVVLPHPEGPSSETISPAAMSSETPDTAVALPYRCVTSS
jgi:hypothetical protein